MHHPMIRMNERNIKHFLDSKVDAYNHPAFIPDDPVSIPHRFTKKQDIEIMGFFAAILAWGQRRTIIRKCLELSEYMDHAPHDFILHHQDTDLRRFINFRHRTFNPKDALYFIEFLRWHYSKHPSLEDAFSRFIDAGDPDTGPALRGFHDYFFSIEDHPSRTKKHVATPARKSTCKRLNMFLRWMVRNDDRGVDFGIWQRISPNQLICPVDVHVARVSRKLGLLLRKQTDWQAAIELTEILRTFDPGDPVKYDFALFGLGVMEKYAI